MGAGGHNELYMGAGGHNESCVCKQIQVMCTEAGGHNELCTEAGGHNGR